MRRLAPLLLLALLAGCLASGDPEAGSFHTAHDLTNGPRIHPLAIPRGLDELDVRLMVEPLDACVVREPARVVLMDPAWNVALALDADAECRGMATARVAATPGDWLVRFEGNATVLAGAEARMLDYPSGRAYVSG